MSKFDQAVQAPQSVGIATLYGQVKTIMWQLFDTTTLAADAGHTAAVLLHKQSDTYSRVKYARLDKDAETALAELEAE